MGEVTQHGEDTEVVVVPSLLLVLETGNVFLEPPSAKWSQERITTGFKCNKVSQTFCDNKRLLCQTQLKSKVQTRSWY